MTTEQAIEILNRYKHRDCQKWHLEGSLILEGAYPTVLFTAFEAVAVAEKYLRDSLMGPGEG